MLQEFKQHIESKFSFLKGSKLLLATSGGIDSMVLVNLCQMSGLDFAVAHCNFQLRESESDADEAFVKEQCAQLDVTVFSQKFDTKAYAENYKLSIQVAARNLRYQWFFELLETNGFDYLLTAHHLDDSLETFLINFTRGSGLDGLTGIPEQNGRIVRPLLPFGRNEIEAFAKENNITWREDSSNASDKYLRNKLRHAVILVLKELNPGLLSSFQNTLANLQQSQSLVDDASRIVYRKAVTDTDLQKQINLKELMQLENYTAYLYQWLQPFGFTDWPAVYDLAEAQSGKQVFSETHALLKDREYLIVYPLKGKESEVYFVEKDQHVVKIPLKLMFSKTDTISVQTTNTIFVDEEKIRFPLEIRKWQEGDLFYPFGMNGKKKLSKFFKDEKFSLVDKSATWLLCSDDQIVWVIGKRQDDRFKITGQTTNILQIQLQE